MADRKPRTLQMGEIYRYARAERPDEPVLDGLPNFYWHTSTDGTKKAKLERGISRLPVVSTVQGDRTPAILLRSTPWKAEEDGVPWRDVFDPATGTLTYFGDNKIDPRTGRPKAEDPDDVVGNRYLRDHFREHSSNSRDRRERAGPLLLFTGVSVGRRKKGNVRFDGLGVVTSVALVNQVSRESGVEYFNYAFTVQLLDLKTDDWSVDWAWISSRRKAESTPLDCNHLPPMAWKRWCREGSEGLPAIALSNPPVLPLSSVDRAPHN